MSLSATSDVSQGSVYGPLLFLGYVHATATSLDFTMNVKLFPDDCAIYSVASSSQDQAIINQNLCKLANWYERWQRKKINYLKAFFFKVT